MYRKYIAQLKEKQKDGAFTSLDKKERSVLCREYSKTKLLKNNDSATTTNEMKNDHNIENNEQLKSDPASSALNVSKIDDNLLDESSNATDPIVLSICRGCMDHELPNLSKLIRIFTSSTFTDTKVERNSLMELVYPRLKEHCHSLGYEFQIVDMRWGVRDEAVDDHKSTELCLRELELCQKLSAGPTFVTFLSHKYGYRPFPRVITEAEFDEIMKRTSEDDRNLVLKWFKKDCNIVPPAYVLQPISTYYPDFLNKAEPEKREQAKATFWKESDEIQVILSNAASQFLKGDEAERYIISVTEMEIQMGILRDAQAKSRTLWFKRNIIDIEKQEATRMLSRFYECRGSTQETVQEARRLLTELKEKKLPQVLPKESIIEYNVHWNAEGIVPDQVEEHATYIKQLCHDFEDRIIQIVRERIDERAQSVIQEPLVQEIVQHSLFCHEKCKHFYGRKSILESIQRYVMSETENGPMIIHGASGCGKTSIMAAAARAAWEWTRGEACIVLRFLGTTQESSNIEALLRSILQQLSRYFLTKPPTIPSTFKQLARLFSNSLATLCRQQRVVLFLDSIDQLDVDLGARLCNWLPLKLNPGLRVVISTLPEEKYEVMPSLKALIKDESAFVPVTSLALSDVSSILESWLASANRTLTEEQFHFIVNAFNECQLPLFLKLCFDESCSWASYSKPSLENSVRSMISCLFSALERDHGKLLVSRALGYLTMCTSGLSEGELEDILSLDDIVLNDTYQFWTPPLRRLPPLLLARIRFALTEYLVERGSDDVRVLVWYHRQFIEAANERYCGNPEIKAEMHGIVAEYYQGVWATTPKPFVDHRGNSGEALRHVAPQPFRYSNQKFNLRKLMQLPEHLIKSGNAEKLKSECLFNFEFLYTKLCGKSVGALLTDAQAARAAFPGDGEIEIMCEVLQLSQSALNYEPSTLAAQLAGLLASQVSIGPSINKLLDQCYRPPIPTLICDQAILTQPGGQLIHVMTAHKKDTTCMSLSQCGKFAVTCADDKSVRIWDLDAAVLVRSIENVGKNITDGRFIRQDLFVLVSHETGVTMVNVKTGVVEEQLSGHEDNPKIIVFDAGDVFAIPYAEDLHVYDASTFKKKCLIEKPESDAEPDERQHYYSSYDVVAARKRYVAIVPNNADHYMEIFDVENEVYVKRYLCFPLPKNDDEDDYSVTGLGLNADESLVMFYSMMDCDLHIHAFPSLDPIKIIKGSSALNMDKCILSSDEASLYTINRREIVRFDLKNDTWTTILTCDNHLTDIGVRSAQDIVTLDSDNSLRIWDLRRAPNSKNVTVVRDMEYSCRIFETFGNERYLCYDTRVSMKSSEAQKTDDNHSALVIYDLQEKKIVQKTRFYVEKKNFLDVKLIDSKRVLLQYDRKLSLFDLENQKVAVEFEGPTAKYVSDYEVCLPRNELWTATRGAKRLKCYDLATGKVKRLASIPLTNSKSSIDNLKVVPDGSLVLASDDEGTFVYGVDPDSGEVKLKMSYKKDTYFFLSDMKFGLKNQVVLTTLDLKLMKETITCLAIFDLSSQKWKNMCFDKVSFTQNFIKKKRGLVTNDEEVDMDVSCYEVVGDTRAVTGSMDAVIRVWDLNSGHLLTRLLGHTQDVSDFYVSSNRECHFLASTSTTDGENALRVWNLNEKKCIATYKMHIEARKYCILDNGKIVLGHYNSMENPVHFILTDENGPFKLPEVSTLPWLENADTDKKIDILLPKSYDRDPADLDSDEDIISSDDDDDDDDIDLSDNDTLN